MSIGSYSNVDTWLLPKRGDGTCCVSGGRGGDGIAGDDIPDELLNLLVLGVL